MSNTIIFSDLDGTLLDSASYSFAAAQPALEIIRARKIPLILCSSKTRAEIEAYRQRLNNRHPFISENGGGIFIPHGYFSTSFKAEPFDGYHLIRLGLPYAEIRSRFLNLRQQFKVGVRGFADMTEEVVAALTGLSLDEARLSKQRDFDEPFLFGGPPDERFLQAIEASGLRWTQGQFFHVLGNHDKGRAVNLLKALYQNEHGTVSCIGLGDSLNDLPLLEAVDRPVLVRHADGSFDARINVPGLLKTRLSGPSGWNEALLQLLFNENISAKATGRTGPHENLMAIFAAALAAVDPYNAVRNSARIEQNVLRVADARYDLTAFERIIVVGAGKATARMALAVESLLGERISAGLIVVKDGHRLPLTLIEQVEAAHPVPDAAGEAGTKRILEMAQAADENTLVICLLSGGASALLVAPVEGVTLRDKQAITTLLLNAGASIGELNAVRKHLSAVKGGRLAQAVFPAQLLTMIISDVIGDRLDVIASGPTAPDGSTFNDALSVIAKYALRERTPSHILEHLEQGARGKILETVKAGDPCLDKTRNVIVGAISMALAAADDKSRQSGLATQIISAELQGEARKTARHLADIAHATLAGMKAGERRCLLSGGETTVTVHGPGQGGRNQELALAFALEAEGLEGVTLFSAGTDGGDGPTDAAGASVDGNTTALARSLEIDPTRYLNDNDSYSFFRKLDALSGGHSHVITGPTGTNVMDIQIMLLDKA